jgi:hypothetical protein
MSRERAVEATASLAGAGPAKVIFTPIGSKQHPTFVPQRVLGFAKGPEILAIVQELRHSLKVYEPKVLQWLEASPDNPQQYARDPLGSLAKLGIRLDSGTQENLSRLEGLLKQASQTVNRREG